MLYLDTDVLVNFLVEQNLDKHEIAGRIFEKASKEGSIFMSFLVLQELSFVLGKLNMSASEIKANINALALLQPYACHLGEYHRAIYLAERVGFQNFNDCLHTAIAERNCDELLTFNKSDFSRIKSFTDLKITLL